LDAGLGSNDELLGAFTRLAERVLLLGSDDPTGSVDAAVPAGGWVAADATVGVLGSMVSFGVEAFAVVTKVPSATADGAVLSVMSVVPLFEPSSQSLPRVKWTPALRRLDWGCYLKVQSVRSSGIRKLRAVIAAVANATALSNPRIAIRWARLPPSLRNRG
jgi:hypothetical protein